MERNHVRAYFTKLGLDPVIADLYMALYTYGEQTISELARSSGVERTRIYRLLDDFKQSGLIEVITDANRDILRAAPISNAHILISKKEQELQGLKANFPKVEQLLQQQSMSSPTTRVQFYKGVEGIKQMFWNETKTTTEILLIMDKNQQQRVGKAFFERWVRARNERGVLSRGIISDEFIQSQKKWYKRHDNETVSNWQARYISPDIFPITHWIGVYNDVVVYHDWKDGEVFGVEIYNQAIADTQRRFFEMLWQQAVSIDDKTGEGGQLIFDKST